MIESQFQKHGQSVHQPRCRDGITAVELIISAGLLITVMSFVTTICFQINLVWKDINHHRVAMGELSNQLEELSRLSREDAQTAIDGLKPSSVCGRSLNKPELTGELIDDVFGTRIVLKINWDRRNPGKPMELVGWIASEIPQKPDKDLGRSRLIQENLTSENTTEEQLNKNSIDIVTSTEATQ
jgi:hypothetical protein